MHDYFDPFVQVIILNLEGDIRFSFEVQMKLEFI